MKIELIRFKGYERPPKRQFDNDAGADVYLNESYGILPHHTIRIPLGFGLKLPDGVMACVYPRSSLAADGVVCQIPPIDSGYRGEIYAIVTNTSDVAASVAKGTRIGQLVVLPVIYADFVDRLNKARGSGAFGSTGE